MQILLDERTWKMENNTFLLGSNHLKRKFQGVSVLIVFILIIAISGLLYGITKKFTYTVEYVKGFGDVFVQTYFKGQKLSLPDAPQQTGYHFMGWSLDENTNEFINTETVINKQLTLYAKWQEKEYSLTFENTTLALRHTSNISLNNNNVIVTTNENSTTITPPAIENKTFSNWIIFDGTNNFTVEEFNFENTTNNNLSLIPIYNDIYVNYNIICNSSHATISKNQTSTIALGNKLNFTVTLNDIVNLSNLEISTTSGEVTFEKLGNNYNVEVKNFNKDFSVNINNITVNSYKISFVFDDETITHNQIYGDKIIFPNKTKEGFNLVGFKDGKNNTYNTDSIITENLTLFPVWEVINYTVEFPKTNGLFIINYNGEQIVNGKTVCLTYGDSLSFEIILSKPYNNSNPTVVAKSNLTTITPIKNGDTFTFNNLTNNLKIEIENIKLNSYPLIVDGKNYGNISYGSWLSVNGNNLQVLNPQSGEQIIITPLINDCNFGGWNLTNNQLLTNCFIQDLEENGTIKITGNYSVPVTRIELKLNGGSCDINEIILINNQELNLPTPTKDGYTFVGWFIKIVEVNTVIDKDNSVKFTEATSNYLTVFAGWEMAN